MYAVWKIVKKGFKQKVWSIHSFFDKLVVEKSLPKLFLRIHKYFFSKINKNWKRYFRLYFNHTYFLTKNVFLR